MDLTHQRRHRIQVSLWMATVLVLGVSQSANAQGLLESAVQLQESGDHSAVVALLQRALEGEIPNRGQALFLLAKSEASLGHRDEAVAHLRAALGLASDQWVADHLNEIARELAALVSLQSDSPSSSGDSRTADATSQGSSEEGGGANVSPESHNTEEALLTPPVPDRANERWWVAGEEISAAGTESPNEDSLPPFLVEHHGVDGIDRRRYRSSPWAARHRFHALAGFGLSVDPHGEDLGGLVLLGAGLTGGLHGTLSYHAQMRVGFSVTRNAPQFAGEIDGFDTTIRGGRYRQLLMGASLGAHIHFDPGFLGVGLQLGMLRRKFIDANVTGHPDENPADLQLLIAPSLELGFRVGPNRDWEGRAEIMLNPSDGFWTLGFVVAVPFLGWSS